MNLREKQKDELICIIDNLKVERDNAIKQINRLEQREVQLNEKINILECMIRGALEAV